MTSGRRFFFFMYLSMMNAGSKKDLRVFSWAKRMNRLSLFSSKFSSKNLPLAGGTKDNEYTWRAQYNGKLYAVFGKNESFLKKKNRLFFN